MRGGVVVYIEKVFENIERNTRGYSERQIRKAFYFGFVTVADKQSRTDKKVQRVGYEKQGYVDAFGNELVDSGKTEIGGSAVFRNGSSVEKFSERETGNYYENGQKIFRRIRTAFFVIEHGKRDEKQSRFFHPLTEYENKSVLRYAVEYVIVRYSERKY